MRLVPANQPVEIARLELVRVPGERLQIAHAVIAGTGAKKTVEGQRAQGRVTAGAAAADGETCRIHQTAFHEIARARQAILHVGDAPLPLQLQTIVAAVARGSAVVHVEHGKPAAGPVLKLEIERARRCRRRPAVTQHQQRRLRAGRRAEITVCGRIIKCMRRFSAGDRISQCLGCREITGIGRRGAR